MNKGDKVVLLNNTKDDLNVIANSEVGKAHEVIAVGSVNGSVLLRLEFEDGRTDTWWVKPSNVRLNNYEDLLKVKEEVLKGVQGW